MMNQYDALLEENAQPPPVTVKTLREKNEWGKTVLGIKHVSTPTDEVLEEMIKNGWTGLERDIPVTNTVCNGRFKMHGNKPLDIDLSALALPLKPFGVTINTRKFPSATFPLRTVKAQVVLFATGKMVITGFIAPSEMYYAVEYVRRLLSRCGYRGIRYSPLNLPVQNVVARLCMPHVISKDKFKSIHQGTESTSDFPGLFVPFIRVDPRTGEKRNWTVLVFDGSLCVFVGWRNRQELQAMYFLISHMLFMSREEEKQ